MKNFDAINDATGFANGDRFENEAQVRAYFTTDSMAYMGLNLPAEQSPLTQDELDDMAEAVIENGWHMQEAE